jgi:geranylgeranyl transferase type-1 subunit beta
LHGDSSPGLTDLPLTLRWLLSRQTATLDEDAELDTYGDETDTAATSHEVHSFMDLKDGPHSDVNQDPWSNRPTTAIELQWVGFNGRCNKIADTCYSWWVGASLAVSLILPNPKPHKSRAHILPQILNNLPLANLESNRRYLYEKTQHPIGGFGKKVGDPPDLYHSYLGLAALSTMGDTQLKPVDSAACFSVDACRHLESLPWRREI